MKRYTTISIRNDDDLAPVLTLRCVIEPAAEEVRRTHPLASVIQPELIEMPLPSDEQSPEYAGRIRAVVELLRMAALAVEQYAATTAPDERRPLVGLNPS